MTLDEIRRRYHELHRHVRAGEIAAAEAIAVELAPELERLFDELDARNTTLSWQCDR